MDSTEDSFLRRFGGTAGEESEGDDGAGDGRGVGAPARAGEMALPGSWDAPTCHECGEREGDEGGGRYGTDDHEGLFFCKTCWQAWDVDAKDKIMRPTWQQRMTSQSRSEEERAGNFFDGYAGGVGSDDVEGSWEPGRNGDRHDDALALPGSWDRPLCVECGNDEGEEGGGRYGHDADADKFYCGRCWRSWDQESRRKMMMGWRTNARRIAANSARAPWYSPSRQWEGRHIRDPMDPMLHFPPPPPPQFGEDEGFDGFPREESRRWEGRAGHGGDEETTDANFFEKYERSEGSDTVEGAWEPSKERGLREGEMALPGSWERPICAECGNDEGEEGGGRYGHDDDADKFFCGRCWKSWDEAARRKMMRGYAPSHRWMDLGARMDPMHLNLAPPPPGDPGELAEEDYGMAGYEGEDDEDEEADWENEEDEYWEEEEEGEDAAWGDSVASTAGGPCETVEAAAQAPVEIAKVPEAAKVEGAARADATKFDEAARAQGVAGVEAATKVPGAAGGREAAREQVGPPSAPGDAVVEAPDTDDDSAESLS